MAENEHTGQFGQQSAGQQSAAQQAAERGKPQDAESRRICKFCGTELDEDSLFCPQCGEEFGGEECICQFCAAKTTQEICPHCGKRVKPVNCPQCGTPSLFDACEQCGALVNGELAAFLAEEKSAPQQMSAEEAQKLEEEFKRQPVSPEFEKFQKRLIERQILLEERDYFNKREKRIIKVFGSKPFSLEIPDPEEEAFRMKAYAALEKTVIERQEKLLQEEWERRFPEEKIAEEKKRTHEEMEQRYQELLSKVENEVEAHRIEEERKKEEERRRKEEERRREEERKRLEQEMYENRLRGYWYHSSHGVMLTIQISITSKTTADCIYTCTVCGGSRIQYAVSFDGSNIALSARSRTGTHCTFREYSVMDHFNGTINNSGTIMSGYLSGGIYLTFYKR